MGVLKSWGIHRELAHSPGRETDDAEILRLTGEELRELDFDVTLKTAEELLELRDDAEVPPFLFVMCERLNILERMTRWEASGIRQVNRPEAILNTYRNRTVELFQKSGIAFPRTVLMATGSPIPPAAETLSNSDQVWVKRGDVHNTQRGDVVCVSGPAGVLSALGALAAREILTAVIQEHIPGDLIKFYGVGLPAQGEDEDASWFEWFYHREQKLAGHPFEASDLRALARRGARLLGLEIFGGDAIAGADGRLVLIDLNAWPSFALYRGIASRKIAAWLAARFRAETGVIR